MERVTSTLHNCITRYPSKFSLPYNINIDFGIVRIELLLGLKNTLLVFLPKFYFLFELKLKFNTDTLTI